MDIPLFPPKDIYSTLKSDASWSLDSSCTIFFFMRLTTSALDTVTESRYSLKHCLYPSPICIVSTDLDPVSLQKSSGQISTVHPMEPDTRLPTLLSRPPTTTGTKVTIQTTYPVYRLSKLLSHSYCIQQYLDFIALLKLDISNSSTIQQKCHTAPKVSLPYRSSGRRVLICSIL